MFRALLDVKSQYLIWWEWEEWCLLLYIYGVPVRQARSPRSRVWWRLCWHSATSLGTRGSGTWALTWFPHVGLWGCLHRHQENEKGLIIDPCETPWVGFHSIVIRYLKKSNGYVCMYINIDLIVCAIFLISEKGAGSKGWWWKPFARLYGRRHAKFLLAIIFCRGPAPFCWWLLPSHNNHLSRHHHHQSFSFLASIKWIFSFFFPILFFRLI